MFGNWWLIEEDVDEGEEEVCVGRVMFIIYFIMGGVVFNIKV